MSVLTLLALGLACTKPTQPEALPQDPAAAEVEAAIAAATGGGQPTAGQPTTGQPTPTASVGFDARREIDAAAALLTSRGVDDAKAAVERLKEVIRREPENPYAHFNLGVAYEILGDNVSAKESYIEASRVDPTFGPAYLNLAAMEMRAGQYERAVTRYRLGLDKDQQNMDLWVGLISALREMGRLDEAEREARNALRINANALNVYNNLGLVYIERSQLDLATFIYQRALGLPGGEANANLHCNYGRIYQLQGKPVDARLEFEQALARDPNLVPAMVYLAMIYLDNRNFEDTVPLLEKARTLDPANPEIYLNLGIAYRGVGRYEDAKAAYEQVLRLQPENPEPHLNLGILYGDYMKAYDAAIAEYEKYVAKGGPQSQAVTGYIEATRDEQERVKKLQARKEKAEREAKERAERDRLLAEEKAKEEALKAQQALQPPAPTPAPDGTTPPPTPAPDGGAAPTPAPAPDGATPAPEWGATPAPAPEGTPAPAPEGTPAQPTPTNDPSPWGGG